jgi:hypothetical protein
VTSALPKKIADQIKRADLPTNGKNPFTPKLTKNKRGELVIEKRAVTKGPKIGKRGYVDSQDRIWIKDRAHSNVPDHWDVQINGGIEYFRVDLLGDRIS